MKARIIYTAGLVWLVCAAAMARTQGAEKAGDKEKDYPSGSAWTLSWPLGSHIEAPLDTSLYNFQRRFVTALASDAWATTGEYSGPALDMIYFDRNTSGYSFLPSRSLSKWIPDFASRRFYNVHIPTTQIFYGWGIGNDNRTDHLKADFAGNVNKDIGLGAWLDFPYTKGSYAYQASKMVAFGLSGYYTGPRYEMQAFYSHWNHLNKENGGITDDLYITDPAQLQGGVNDIEPQSIPTRLSAAHNRLVGGELYMSHAWKLGFWRDISQPEDTVVREEYVPVTRFVYSFDWKTDHHMFLNTNASEARDFWTDTYFNMQRTRDDAYHWSVSNTLGVEMIEGFQRWAKFGLSAYATVENDKWRYETEMPGGDTPAEGLTSLPEGWDRGRSGKRTRLWAGARLAKTRGTLLRYAADAKFGLLGDAIGDIDVSGNLSTSFKAGRDTMRIMAEAAFRNLEPDYMLNHYVGNHFIWNNNFGKTRSLRAGARLYIPWTGTTLRADAENLQNLIYFSSASTPRQHSGHIRVLSASIDQKLRFGIWNWNNTVTWQHSSLKRVLPLPEWTVYSNMFLNFRAFKVLTMQIGVDCNWYSKYRGVDWQPATMTFHVQGSGGSDVGNFIFSDAYITAKIYQVRLFLLVSYLNQGWWSRDYFSMPHYPVDPRQFRIGLSIDFTN